MWKTNTSATADTVIHEGGGGGKNEREEEGVRDGYSKVSAGC